MTQHVIRPVRADEWEKVKELRLAALRDPVAPLAFLETVDQAAAKPDEFWQDRARGAAEGNGVRQFVAEAPDGRWDGTVTVFLEEIGAVDFLEQTVERNQGHVVGVFVRAEQRGTGITDALFEAALEWAWSREQPALECVRLFVHEDNERAGAFYRRFGFEPSGLVIPKPGDPTSKELEHVFARPEGQGR